MPLEKDIYVPPATLNFIKENTGLIRAVQFNKLFVDALNQLSLKSYLSLIDILRNAKVDVLQYMNYIPVRFFERQNTLYTYKVPENIFSIEDSAFFLCKNLQTIELHKNLKKIAPVAFDGCTRLFQVIYKGTKEDWKKVEVSNIKNNLLFKCGIDCVDGLIEYEFTGTEWKIKE